MSIDRYMWYIYTIEDYLVCKKNETMSFAVRERKITYVIAYMWNLNKTVQINCFTKNRTDSQT